MISDFICEEGFLYLRESSARVQLEYDESGEGYWTNERFMKQMDEAVKLAEKKYPRTEGYRHV